MSGPKTSRDTRNATSLPASASGHTRCEEQGGGMIPQSGPPVARASLSARQAKTMGLLMSGIFGQPSFTLSKSCALASSLANRLQAKAALSGSTLYALTWKMRGTPSQHSIFALRASAHRTSDNGCTGWPTAQARDWKGAPSEAKELSHNARPLNEVARLAGWRSPNTVDSQLGSLKGQGQVQLCHQVLQAGPARRTARGQVLTGSTAEMESGGQLNPAHPRWLMALPHVWDDCAPTATRSARKSQNSSSGRGSKRRCDFDDDL
jgi:hypothetical protein